MKVSRGSLALSIVILLLTADVVLAQLPTATPPPEIATLQAQVQVMSTQMADLNEIVKSPPKDVWDILASLSGVSAVLAAIIVALIGGKLARNYEEKRHKRDMMQESQWRDQEYQRQQSNRAEEQIRLERELKIAQTQTVQVFIPFLEQKGTRRRAALTIISDLGNEQLSQQLSQIYPDENEDPAFVDQRRARLQAALVRDSGSPLNNVANRAVNELRDHGWLKGDAGLLKEAALMLANLTGAKLREANLAGTNLERAELMLADLTGADLAGANLSRASLFLTELLGADLVLANLMEANLSAAKLRGANLAGANLEGAKFYEKTELPDGTQWTPDTDMTRFTDPNHPKFWRSDDPDSPAYRGGHTVS